MSDTSSYKDNASVLATIPYTIHLQQDPTRSSLHIVIVQSVTFSLSSACELRRYPAEPLSTSIMHFAMPPRKTSQPPPYARASRSSPIRRKQLQFLALIGCTLLLLIYLATRLFGSSVEKAPPDTPEVVVVTLLDEATMSDEYRARIMENRKYYAEKNGMFNTILRLILPLSDNRHLQVTPRSSQMFQTTSMGILLGAGPWCLLYGMP